MLPCNVTLDGGGDARKCEVLRQRQLELNDVGDLLASAVPSSTHGFSTQQAGIKAG